MKKIITTIGAMLIGFASYAQTITSITISGPASFTQSVTSVDGFAILTEASFTGDNPDANDYAWVITNPNGGIVEGFTFRPGIEGVVSITARGVGGNSAIFSNTIVVSLAGFVPLTTSTSVISTSSITTRGGTSQLTIDTYLPTNASNPTKAYSSSDNCIMVVDANGLITAKRNGTATITARIYNGGSSFQEVYTVTATNQLEKEGFFETFSKPFDGNGFGGESSNITGTYFASGARTGQALNGGIESFSDNGIMNLTVTSNPKSDILANHDLPFWSAGWGNSSPAVYMGFTQGSFPWNTGCGVQIDNNEVEIKLENKTSSDVTMYLSVTNDSGNGIDQGNGTSIFNVYPITLTANTMSVVKQTLLNTGVTVKYMKLGFGNFSTPTANILIDYIKVGVATTTSVSLSASPSVISSTDIRTSIITGMISPANAAMEIVDWAIVQSQPNIATLGKSSITSGTLTATGIGNGTVTIMGFGVGSQLMGMTVVTITNQVITAVVATVPTNTVEVEGELSFTSQVLPTTFNQSITWSVLPATYGTVTVVGANNIFMAGTTLGVATITGESNLDFEKTTSFTVTIVAKGTLSVAAAINASSVVLYPNPATDKVSVSGVEVARIIVVNTLGQVVATSTSDVVNVSGVNAGIYKVLITSTSGASVTKTLIKE